MNKKAKTKAQKADEDANLDEALDESFPASDPPSMTPSLGRSGRDAEKTEETPEGSSDPPPARGSRALGRRNRFVATVNHPRLVKTRVFQQTVRTRQAPLRTRLTTTLTTLGGRNRLRICSTRS